MYRIVLTLFLALLFKFSDAQISSLDSNGVSTSVDSILGYTIIDFRLVRADTLDLVVYNRWGSIEAEFLDENVLNAGYHTFNFIPKGKESGVYLYMLINKREQSEAGNLTYVGAKKR